MSSATRADDLARLDGVMPSTPDAATSTSSLAAEARASSASAPGWGAAGPVAILIDELIGALRPTPASDRRRRAVFQHVADLINGCFENENVLVTAFGSVPLRTYLPDGDIDVCLLGPHDLLAKDPCWTNRLRDHIEFAEADAAAHDTVSPFAVSEIHVVHAEVRLMKCICDGVVVDVSANQFGGLATLGFLEEVDFFVSERLNSPGLFKRSIVLIKAWGFYEGRLLGAHHALISTYALETLVLYVLNKFHRSKSLTTPLEVLHTFLQTFAEFDWDTHAVSIHGPVLIADLVNGTVSGDEVDVCEDELLTREFMWRMLDKYGNESIMRAHAASSRGGASGAATSDAEGVGEFLRVENSSAKTAHVRMPIKHLNVIDPLLPSNNLGRSVSQGNAARIRKALKLAAAKLGALREMSTRSDSCDFLAARVLREFFGNTVKHRRVALLPSAPATPGGREHADEVSMTPATQRRHSVTVLQSPREKEKSGGDSADPEKSGLARRLENSLSDPALLQLRVQTNASSSSKESNARSPSDSGSDSSSDPNSPRWPHLGPASPENERAEMGLRCPVMHRTVRVEDEDRGPFWGRWEPLPAAELAAAAAAEALANRHFPRLSDASTDPSDERDERGDFSAVPGNAVANVGSPTRDANENENENENEREKSAAVAAAAFVAAVDASARAVTPRRARGLSLGGDGDFAAETFSGLGRQLAGGSTPGGSSRAESRGASTRGGEHFAENMGATAGMTGVTGDAFTSSPRATTENAASEISDRLGGFGLGSSLLGTSPTKGSSPSSSPPRRRRADVGQAHPRAPPHPPVPPGPPPPGVARAAREAAAARVRREANVATFFPETFEGRFEHPRDAALFAPGARMSASARGVSLSASSPPISMPPPAVTPPSTVGIGSPSPPKDIFAGDLDAIWRHLEFGRHYHRVAMRRRYEYERAAQRAAAAAAAAVRRGAFGPNGEFIGGADSRRRGRETGRDRDSKDSRDSTSRRNQQRHSRAGSFSSGGENARDPNPPIPGAPPERRAENGGKATRARSRKGKGDAANSARDANGGPIGGFAAAAAAAIAAGAEPPRGSSRAGRRGAGGGRASSGGAAVSNVSERRKNPSEDPPSSFGKEKNFIPSEKDASFSPPPPPGPPPGGEILVVPGDNDYSSAPSESAPPSWGPKGAAALEVIRRAPSVLDVADAEAPADAKGREPLAPAPAPPALASATGTKGSWSSLVAAGDPPKAQRLRDETRFKAPPGEVETLRGSRLKSTIGAPASADAVDATLPAPPPSRPLAGAWAKGPVTDALKKPVTKSAVTKSAKEKPSASSSSPETSPSSPASETSGDSNASQKENPKGAKAREDERDTPRAPGSNPGPRDARADGAAKDPTFVRKEDDFPGLGGAPAATAATAGVWGGRKAE